MDPSAEAPSDGSTAPPNDGLIDWSIFSQILEMDEDQEEREFSSSLVLNFFEQAEHTFDQIQLAVVDKKLAELSSLGHFLKGSSAALGLTKLTNSCEKIQNYGAMKDEYGVASVNDEELCLQRIQDAFTVVKGEYDVTKAWLKKFFGPTLTLA